MTPINTDRATAIATILRRAVCLVLTCRELGNNRKVDLKRLVDAAGGTESLDEQQFHATMRLISPKELLPVKRVQSQAKAFLRSAGLPAHGAFGGGTYLVPLDRVEEVDDRLVELDAELRAESARLADRYAAAVAAQAVALGPLFQPQHYKTEAEVARAFALDWSYVSFENPEQLESVSRAVAESARRRYETRLTTAYDEVVVGLRAEALDVMRDLEARLTPGPDGKMRVLRGTALRDLQAFVASLPSRNLADDEALEDAMARVARLADGIDVGVLRDSVAVREEMRALAGHARQALEGLVETGRRAICLEPDGVLA